jgi:hypothetical protein
MVGPFPGFNTVSADELAQYSVTEAAFFGNLFQFPPIAKMAVATGYHWCASRACVRPDGSCNCGIVEVSGGSCTMNGVIQGTSERYIDYCYDYSDAGYLGDNPDIQTYQVITTRITAKPNGAMCAANWECQSQLCASGQCSAPLSTGSPCTADYQCQTQLCSSGHCFAPLPVGGACTDFWQCQSQLCSSGVCSVLSCGAVCYAAVNCAAGVCGMWGCGRNQGDACSSPSDCGSCDCYQGLCAGTTPSGIPCWTDLECISHQCAIKGRMRYCK